MADISALMLKVDSSGVQKATADLKNFSKSASDASSSSGQINEALSGLNTSSLAAAAGVGATIAALYKLTSALGAAAKASLQMYSHFEQMENGLSTVFQSAEKGKAVFEDLRKFSFSTTFGVDELADAATQLYNVGMAEDEVKSKLSMLGDLAGGQKQKFAELVSVYSKIVSTGKAGAMQMQQLALRGIPIRQELEKIGVTGTATAEQITQAFQNMTGEGGRFHNAMQNIISTIEGKEGFLSDTLKEMQVNFADASGMAEAYKSVLDILYGAVQKITDALAAINENPTAKMIFQGVLVAAIGALAGVIATALIPVLSIAVGLIASLAAAAAPFMAVGAAIGLVGLAFVKATEHGKELTKEIDDLVERKRELDEKNKEGTSTFEEQIELQKIQLELARKQREEVIKRNEAMGESYGDDNFDYDSYDEAQAAFEIEKAKYQEMLKQKETMEYYAKIYKDVVSEAQKLKQITEQSNSSFQTALELAENFYKQTKQGRIEALRAQAMMTQNALYGRLEERTSKEGFKYMVQVAPEGKEKQKLEEFLNHIRAEIKKAENEGKTTVKLKTTMPAAKTAVEEAWENYRKTSSMQDMGFASEGDRKEALVKALQSEVAAELSKYQAILDANSGRQTDESMALEKSISKHQEQISLLEKELDIWGYLTKEMSKYFVGLGMSEVEANKLASGLVNIANTTIPNQLTSGLQSIGKALGDGSDTAEAAKQVLLQTMQTVLSQIGGLAIAAGLRTLVDGGLAALPIALALFALGGAASVGAGFLSSVSGNNEAAQREKEQLELLKAINEQYKSLYSALKDEEAYYLEKKRQINSSGVNANAGLMSVNDMILTPEGNFSTSPKDYLIATKHPESLVGGSVAMSVTINNTMGDSANVSAQRSVGPDGQQQLVVMISKKVAQDYATGMNGWDSAIDANSMRRKGRSLA